MYDSLMEHFTNKSWKATKSLSTHDLEAAKSTRQHSKSSSVDIEGPTQESWIPSRREKLVMATCAVSSLVVALDATILVPVLPTLAIDLNGTAAEAFWTGTSYLLTHAVLQPFIAAMSDIFGRRELLVPSIIFFMVGSIVCAVANDFTVMLLGRVLQGVGGAGIITLSQIIFADMVPLRLRPKYFSIVLAAWALGTLLGPLLGGVFVEKVTWRWCFWLNLPICALALPMATFFVTLVQPATKLATKIGYIDWFGNVMFIASLTSILIAISWAGIQFEWSSVQVLVPLILGIFGLLFSLLWEYRYARYPFLNHRIFKGKSVIASYLAALLQGLTLYMALYYGSFYFTACHFFGPIRTGVSIMPVTALLVPGSMVVSILITRTGHFRWAVWSGFVIATISAGLFILWDADTKTPVWAVIMCFFGLGMGMALSSINISIQAAVSPKDCGQAAAMYAFMRSLGMTIGVAVGGTVFQNVMKGRLQDLDIVDAASIAKQAEGFVAQLKEMSTEGMEGVLRQEILDGYVHGFRGTYIVMTGVSALGLLVSLFIKAASLDAVLLSKFRVREKK